MGEPFLILSSLAGGSGEQRLPGEGGVRAAARGQQFSHTHTRHSPDPDFTLPLHVPSYTSPLSLHSHLWSSAEHKDRVPVKLQLPLPPAGTF